MRDENDVLSELSDSERALLKKVLEIELARVGFPDADTTEDLLTAVKAVYQ